jgi:hypothetical protein
VSNVYLQATGKLPTFTSGSTKWLRIVAQGNFFLQQWARERGVDWYTLYDPAYPLGTASTAQEYDLDDEILKISQQDGDSLRITHTDLRYTDYTIVNADQLRDYNYDHYVARVGRRIRFNRPFLSTNPQFGGTITVPVYLKPEIFSADTDEINIDDPNWLVFVTAADMVRNDVTRKDLRADLISQANEAMMAMREDNESQFSEVLRPWSVGDRTDWF